MMPNGTMRTHDHHAVQKSCQQHIPAEKMKNKQEEKRRKAQNFQPAKKGEPVPAVFKNVES